MCFQICRVDHDRLVLGVLGGQTDHDPGEDPVVAPSLPTIIKGLGWAVFLWGITPSQTIAIDENYTTQHTPVVDARLAMALRKEGFSRSICASVSQ